MVGLTIVLETTNNNTFSDCKMTPKVVNKSAVKITESACLRRGFLEHCFFCSRKLLPAKDIYMYQGDRAFCSVECRSKQMVMDEEESLKYCSSSVVKTNMFESPALAPSSSDGHRRDLRNRKGGFAY